MIISDDEMARYREQFSTATLLGYALKMLETAAEQTPATRQWLTNNLTLAVIRDRVNLNSNHE